MANLTTTSSKPRTKSLGDPNPAYESLVKTWERSRAILNGQTHARAYDDLVDTISFTNLLLPFSPTMSQQQYNFYRAESELPGLTSSYAKVLLGGLLRKPAIMVFPDEVPEEAEEWLRTNFGAEGNSLHSFLDEAIYEELQTSRAWILVDYPEVPNYEDLSVEEASKFSPYAMVVKAENVINWRQTTKTSTGKQALTSLVLRYYREDYSKNQFHPDLVDTVSHYYLDDSSKLVIDTYQRQDTNETIGVINGVLNEVYRVDGQSAWTLINSVQPQMNGERVGYIPAWPLNGSVNPTEPILLPLIDREISLYNKVSRRNHLLYGAATYTPVVKSDMTEEEFEEIVSAGLGSWIKVRQGDDVKALETPTGALSDMEKAIENTVSEMSKMGIRMLSPEGSGDSGVALEIRNASQTAKLGLLNAKISQTMKDVICTMLNWKYGLDLYPSDIQFNLSSDLNPAPMGADWMRLLTEWYERGVIARSTFIEIAKHNDILPSDYNDDDARQEIQDDPFINNRATPVSEELLQGT
jgi:hypothetical protein